MNDAILNVHLRDALGPTAWERFRDGFRTSHRGNRTRIWNRWRVTVFAYGDGSTYGWCRGHRDDPADRPRYSPERYGNEVAAAWAAFREVW